MICALGLIAALLLGGCAVPQGPSATPPRVADQTLPPARSFGVPHPTPPERSNTEISRDFLDLSFKLESGADLLVLTRFQQPVTLSLTGRITPVLGTELDRLVARLRTEAHLDVRRLPDHADASLTVEGITRDQIDRIVPTAACFVLPRRISWAEFSRHPRRHDLNWAELTQRDAATVFIPTDVSPQEVRDCLHEEISQALGPVNDLFRLEDSVYNDDNMRSVLTGFDMLVLRVTYDPALHDGMTRAEVAAALPGILARLNPHGTKVRTRPYQPSPRTWVDAIEEALSNGKSDSSRRQAAKRALAIAQEQGWEDTRLGLSWLTMGRLASAQDGDAALDAFLTAGTIYSLTPATAINAANVGIQIAAFALAGGQYSTALEIANHYIPVAMQAENAALLTDFLMVKSVALDRLGKPDEGQKARLDSYAWGRYGLRSDQAILERAAEIASLAPEPQEGS